MQVLIIAEVWKQADSSVTCHEVKVGSVVNNPKSYFCNNFYNWELVMATRKALWPTGHILGRHGLDQLCLTQMAYWAKNYVTILTRAVCWVAYIALSELNWAWANVLSVWMLTRRVAGMIKWHWGPPASKMSNSRLLSKCGQVASICRILLLQRKPKLAHTKPLIGLHAARGLGSRVAGWT